MDFLAVMRAIKEIGIATGAFGLCAWVVVYIVKKIAVNLEKLETAIDLQIKKQELFMSRVKSEHDNQTDDHKEFAAQNKEITATLGRINGFKKD